MQTLIVPLDGSELAELALPWAKLLAQTRGFSITLLRTVRAARSRFEVGPRIQREDTSPAFLEASSYLARLRNQLVDEGLDVSDRVERGASADVILDLAARHDAAAIVMATHGRGGLNRFLAGSVATEVVREATTPVLLVPPQWSAAEPPTRFGTILVPLDGSALAEHALSSARVLAKNGGRLVLTRVVTPIEGIIDWGGFTERGVDEAATKQSEAEADSYLVDLSRRISGAGEEVSHMVRRGRFADEIEAAAAAADADLIVMTTHGFSGFQRRRIGSVADEVVRKAATPILVISARMLASRATVAQTVSDVMNNDVLVLPIEEPLPSAFRRMLGRESSIAVVVGSDGEVAGTLSMRDLLEWQVRTARATSTGRIELRSRAEERSVADILPRTTITMDASAKVEDAEEVFLDQHVDEIPVVRDGKPVGILGIRDVVEAAADSWLHESTAA